MDTATSVLLAVVAMVALNQLVLRVGALRARKEVFWSLQALNLAALCFVLVVGLPGFERWPGVSWLIGLMIMFRTVQNNGLRARYLREDKHGGRAEHARKVAEITAKLRASEE
jgi:hypothetical protein